MSEQNRWYFSKEKIQNSPSRKCGIEEDKEISYRQHAANFIQDMGQKLYVTQLCINTAIVYMHRFYMFHSFTRFHRNAIAACAIFLAAKVEEQPRKLEHVIRVAHRCLNQNRNKQNSDLDIKSQEYQRQSYELVVNENIMLQTLGFEIGIDHPHTSVVKCCQLVKAPKDLAQTSYFMATSSLHLTTMCLQYKPTIVACFCIHMACKWSNWEIPVSNEGKQWFCYVDETVTLDMLEKLTSEFLYVFERLSDRLKKKNHEHHRAMGLPSSSFAPNSSSGDKKSHQQPLPSSSSNTVTASTQQPQQQQSDPDKQRSLSNVKPSINNDNKATTQNQASSVAMTTTTTTTSRIDSGHNLLTNGPIKRERLMEGERSIVNKQFDNNNKSKEMYYNNPFSRDNKPSIASSLTVDKKVQIKQEFNKDYNKPSVQATSSSLISAQINKSSHLQSTSSSHSKGYNITTNVPESNSNPNDKNNNQKQPTKQQQIQLEKQRQQDERNRIRPKNQDYLWDNCSNKPTTYNVTSAAVGAVKLNNSLSSSATTASFANNNSSSTNSSSTVNHSFFDNLVHNSSIYNSNSNSSNDANSLSKSPKMNWELGPTGSNSNEDSFDPKKELVADDVNSDLKMEFSDNDSNQSGVNLNALPSLFMSETINGQSVTDGVSSANQNATTTISNKTSVASTSSSKNSFMSIFKTGDDTTNSAKKTIPSSTSNSGLNNPIRSSMTNNSNNLSLGTNHSSSMITSSNNLTSSNSQSLIRTQQQQQPQLQQTQLQQSQLQQPQQQQQSTSLLNTSNNHSSTNLSTSNSLSNLHSQQSLPVPPPILPPTLLPPLPPQPFSTQTSVASSVSSYNQQTSSMMNQFNQSNSSHSINSTIHSAINSTLNSSLNPASALNSTLNSSMNSMKTVNSSDNLLQNHNHHLYNNSYSTMTSSLGSSLTNSFNSSASDGLQPIQQSMLLSSVGDDSYHKSSSGKSKNKDKDKDRESKHHKKHKSKDKHKKHKSKDKERSSSKHATSHEKLPSPIKLIIKTSVNEKSDDDFESSEKPLKKLKVVIPKTLIATSTTDRKRKQSPKDGKDKRIKAERD